MKMLEQLPSPAGKVSGWPWSEEAGELPPKMPNGEEWPLISIVTPSYNQGEFLEETIRSVLLQNYPRLEYIVMDGGSSDESVDILKKYDKWLSYWVSEKDGGQSNAINSGFRIASGRVVNWLNSDDYLEPGALRAVAIASASAGDSVAWVGACRIVDREGKKLFTASPVVNDASGFANWGEPGQSDSSRGWVGQPSCFFDRDSFVSLGGLDKSLYFTMDVDLWIRLARKGQFSVIDEVISSARVYPGIKSLEDFPSQMTEHVVVNWKNDEKGMAREKILEFGRRYSRQYLFELDVGDFFLLVLTWLYRRLVKGPVLFLKRTLGL